MSSYPSNREYDENRPANPHANPLDVAARRANRFTDPLDRHRFLEAFGQARVAEHREDRRLYLWYRAALEEDDSVRVAGLIEGAASVPGPGRKRVL